MSSNWGYNKNFRRSSNYSRPAPAQQVTITTAAPAPARQYKNTAAAPAQKQYKKPGPKQYTDEEKVLLKETRDELFRQTFQLAVLPGNIPLCFAVNGCLVTDYTAWMDFTKNTLAAYAEKLFERKNGIMGEAPFTWGFRPLPTDKLDDPAAPVTCAWVWNFIQQNILPYQAARETFLQGLLDIINKKLVPDFRANLLEPGDDTKATALLNEVDRCVNSGEGLTVISMESMKFLTAKVIARYTIPGIAPGDLKAYYTAAENGSEKPANVPDLSNLKLLQDSQIMKDLAFSLNARADAASAGLSDAEGAAPAQRQQTAQQTPRAQPARRTPATPQPQSFISESDEPQEG